MSKLYQSEIPSSRNQLDYLGSTFIDKGSIAIELSVNKLKVSFLI